MKGIYMRRVLTCASVMAMCVAGGTAFAQEQQGSLEEIVVTAQKREQRLQDVPVAVTALTAQALTVNRITNVRDLDGMAPGLTIRAVSGGSSLPTYSMRGILTAGNQPATDKGVAIYIDGVFIGGATGTMFNMADIERIEVLRGPQGTLFGRNATAGAISITTRIPPGEFQAKQQLSYGNYDQFRSVTSVSTPQMGPFSALGSYSHSERRGDIRNLGAGTTWNFTGAFNGKPTYLTSPKYLGDSNSDAVFGAIKGDFGDLQLIYRFDYSQEDSTAPGTGVVYSSPAMRGVIAAQPDQSLMTQVAAGRPKAVNNAAVVPSRSKSYGHALTATYQVSDAVSIKNVAAYRVTRTDAEFQDIAGYGGLVNTGGSYLGALIQPAAASAAIGAPLIWQVVSIIYDAKQWSNETQLNVDTDPVTFTGGGIYYRQESTFAQTGTPEGLGNSRNGTFQVYPGYLVPSTVQPATQGGRPTNVLGKSFAVYGQAEVHVAPGLDLIGGIRYTNERKTGTDRATQSAVNTNTFPINFKDNVVTYSLGANYKPTQDILLYGKYSTGYIAGGTFATLTFAPETAKSWEGGIKADWLHRMLRTNLALYSVRYDGMQINLSTRTSPGYQYLAPLGVTQVLVNAGSGRAKGFELETTLSPVSGLNLGANVGYLDFKYINLNPSLSTGLAAFKPVSRPKWTVALSAQYTSPPVIGDAHISARIDANWRSHFWSNGSLLLPGGFVSGGAAFTQAEADAYNKAMGVKAYWLANGRLALEGIDIHGHKGTVALWSRNMFDSKSKTFVIGFQSHGAAMYEAARTVGVDLTLEY